MDLRNISGEVEVDFEVELEVEVELCEGPNVSY